VTTFIDGPAAGTNLMLRRAPIYLRVTIDAAAGKVDALDQLDDRPEDQETVHVYRKVPGTRSMFCIRPGGCFETAEYRWIPDAVGEELRETSAWRAWVDKRAMEEGLTC
jgi:hypothetical protein